MTTSLFSFLGRRAVLFAGLLCLSAVPVFAQVADLQLQAQVPNDVTYKLRDRVPWSATINPRQDTYPGGATWIAFVTGQDIYGNTIYIQVARGVVPPIQEGQNFEIANQFWTVPNDGTLFNVEGGYQFIFALYDVAPTTDIALLAPGLSVNGRLKIDVIANLAVPSPAVIYPGTDQKQFFRGGDIAQFQAYWFNNVRGEATANGRVQSRPLRARDRYSVDLRLSSNPAFNIAALPPDETAPTTPTVPDEDDQLPEVTDEVGDDFKLMRVVLAADLGPGTTPNGFSQIRRVEVTGTPPGTSAFDPLSPNNGALNPYGLVGIANTERSYDPQPYDGFLDIGEQVSFVTEQLMPDNFVGRYFVGVRVAMNNPDLDAARGNNVFVSNSAPKIELVNREAPTLQPASAVSDDNGVFVEGGYNASDFSSVSEFGEVIAFESSANNLLLPPQLARTFVAANGGGANCADPANYPAIIGGNVVEFSQVQPFLTVGRQIFLKYRLTGEVVLASRDISGVQANADAINPWISADGKHVAFESRASNLSTRNTGGRSSIYVFNTQTLETKLVSVRFNGTPANGDCYRPRLSSSGRFVVFESRATNLDPARTVAANAPQQVYLHDRDTDADGNFDESNAIATYLVSLADVAGNLRPFNGLSARPVVNLNDTPAALTASGGRMYVAFTSYAGNAPDSNGGYSMIYRAAVDVSNPVAAQRGAIPAQLLAVSLNPDGAAPEANGYDPMGAFVRPDCDEAAINGDGSVIAFTSAATNFVPNEELGGYTPTYPNNSPFNPSLPPVPGVVAAGDYNRVPDVFVRDLSRPFPGPLSVVRVSVSDERVATGTISFLSGPGPGNVPDSQPTPGDAIVVSDGDTSRAFIFGNNVAIGANVQITRDNLVREINLAFGGRLLAEPTTPPNTFDPPDDSTGVPFPGLSYNASIYVKNAFAGVFGNVPFAVGKGVTSTVAGTVASINVANGDEVTAGDVLLTLSGGGGPVVSVTAPVDGTVRNLSVLNGAVVTPGQFLLLVESVLPTFFADGMRGGGRQAEDDALAPGRPLLPPVLGVPYGSGQPTIDRSGKAIAFRTIATNLDVYEATDENTVPALPPFPSYPPRDPFYPAQERTLISGELIRPLIFPTANIYLHERQADPTGDVDAPENTRTTRVSVSNFGYPTVIFGTQPGGINANTSAANHSPAISASGRFISFSSDSTAEGGLIFRQNNLTWPLDQRNVRNVFVQDRQLVGDNPPDSTTRPTVELTWPPDGLRVQTGSEIGLSATARAQAGKTITSVQFFVNGVPVGAPLTAEPYATTTVLRNEGQYVVRVVATDSRGITQSDSATISAGEPTAGQPPLISVIQPPAQANYVLGSQLVFNAATEDADGEVASVTFFLGGQPIAATEGFDGNWYADYRVSRLGTFTFFASATDDDGNTTVTPVSNIGFFQTGNELPSVKILSNSAGLPAVAGGIYPLRAQITSPPAVDVDEGITSVSFFADGVYLGFGTLQEDGTYLLNWQVPATPRTYSKIYAYLSTPNGIVDLEATNPTYANIVVKSTNFLTVTTVAGSLPTVSITSPQNSAVLPQSPLTIAWNSGDADGSVQRAEVFINGITGVDANGAPMIVLRNPANPASNPGSNQFQFFPPSEGTYTIVVRVADNAGVGRDSSAVTVTIDNDAPNPLPDVLLSADPIAEQQYTVGSDVFFNAEVRPKGSNTIPANGVRFVEAGSRFNLPATNSGVPPRPGIFASPFTFNSEGTYRLSAVATDSAGNVGRSGTTVLQAVLPSRPFPTVEMLDLNPGTTTAAGGFVTLQANARFPVSATNADAAVRRVEFYVNGTYVGIASNAPPVGTNGVADPERYQFNWRIPSTNNALTNAYRVQARAVALDRSVGLIGDTGLDFFSSVVSDDFTLVTPGAPTTPVVSIKSPLPGTKVPVGQPVTLLATASIPGSTIARVDYYANGDIVGSSANAGNSYSVVYTPPSKGEVTLIAVAVSARGFQGKSEEVKINVPVEGQPEVTITSPADNAIFTPGSTFTVSADVVVDEGAPIRDVRFFLNEVEIVATNPETGEPLPPDNTAPYSAQVTLQGVGNYFLKAVATDIYGNIDADVILVVCGVPPGGGASPVVYMTHPTPAGQTGDGNIDNVNDFSTPSQFFFNAKIILPGAAVIEDPANDVKFFANGEPIGESGGIPPEMKGVKEYNGSYSIYWQPSGNGDFNITAQVTATYTDGNGNKSRISSVSAPLFFQIGNVSRFIPSIKLRPIGTGFATVNSRVLIQAETNQGPEPIDRIDFYANGVLIGSATPRDADNTQVTTTFEWVPTIPNPAGKPYIISARAVQVVEGGADSGADNSVISNPVSLQVTATSGSAPLVNLLQQPIAESLYVYGSQLFLNASVLPRGGATIPANGVKFYYNSEVLDAPRSGILFGSQNIHTAKVSVEDGVPEITLFASARDSNNATSSSSVATLQADRPLFPLPEVEMLSLFGPGPFSAGEELLLRARAKFPPSASTEARVEFYANGAYLGAGIEDPNNPGLYVLTWETPAVTGNYVIEARAVALNFTRNVEDNNSQRFFGSTVSANSVTAPVQAIPADLVPGSNGAFVVEIYQQLVYRDPTYQEWFEATDALDAGVIDRASFVMSLMGFDPVRKVFNRQVDFGRTSMTAMLPFYRLGISPTAGQVATFIGILESDDTPLPIFGEGSGGGGDGGGGTDGGGGGAGEDGDYSGIPDAPWGATYGMGVAMQEVVLRSAQFRLKYPAVTGLANLAFNNWLRDVMFRGVSGGDENLIIQMMNTIVPQAIRQGAAMAFRSELAWVSLESGYEIAPEQLIQLQAASTILNFQLNGVWDPDYGKKNPYSKSVVQSLLSTAGVAGGSGGAAVFRGPARSYQGVFGDAPAQTASSSKSVAVAALSPRVNGELRVNTTTSGAYTATVTLANGKTHRFKGLLKGDGSIQDQWAPGLSVNLAPVDDAAAKYLGGTVSLGGDSASAVAGRLIYSKDSPFGLPGNYTLSLRRDPAPAANDRLQGSGFATVRIGENGVARLAGRLADNTRFTASIPVWGATGQPGEQALLVYRTLAKGAGNLGGQILRRNNGIGTGDMIWNVAPSAVGPAREVSVDAALSPYNGMSNGTALPAGWPWSASFSLDWHAGTESGAVGFIMPGTFFGSDGDLLLKINPSSGLVGGSFIDAQGTKYKIGGILDQANKAVDGFFLTPQSSGRLEINR